MADRFDKDSIDLRQGVYKESNKVRDCESCPWQNARGDGAHGKAHRYDQSAVDASYGSIMVWKGTDKVIGKAS